MGKSLYVRRLLEAFQKSSENIGDPLRVITLHGPDINNDAIVKVLCSVKDSGTSSLMYHLDISERVSAWFCNSMIRSFTFSILPLT